jgi:hypothetical protein
VAKYALPIGSPTQPIGHIYGLPAMCEATPVLAPGDRGFESDSLDEVMAYLCQHWQEFKLCKACLDAYYAVMRPDVVALKSRLLGIGGNHFQITGLIEDQLDPEHVATMLESASAVSGSGATLRKGKSRACHDNSRHYAASKRSGKFVHHLGLALSEDGCWRIHSWVVGPKGIIETTESREVYFGVPAAPESNPGE